MQSSDGERGSDPALKPSGVTGPAQRAHFRIDWRQLTYYSKEQRSYLGNLFGKDKKQKQPAPFESQLRAEAGCELGESDTEDNSHEEEGQENESSQRHGDHTAAGLSRPLKRPKRRAILNSLDGCFRSGELTAILGPSGAGKSTFLDALFGSKQENSYGQTKVTWFTNGQQQQQQQPISERAIRIAVIPQKDHLLDHLSVYETLMFASKIKNPHKASDKLFHRQNVRRVGKMLKLTDCFGTRCNRLSGGQYKRVSIGQELLSEPDVIILDEPTSGLDAMTCLTTIRTLKSIVLKHPISIILTIHQPDTDVFSLFDQVYVIAQGGMAIYEGPPADIVPTLAQANLYMPSESYNPARFIVENAFLSDLEAAGKGTGEPGLPVHRTSGGAGEISSGTDDDDDEDEDEADEKEEGAGARDRRLGAASNFLRRSISSLTDALSGKTLELTPDHLLGGGGGGKTGPPGAERKFRDSGRRPLLNIGIRTADGTLITSDQLGVGGGGAAAAAAKRALDLESQVRKQQLERLQLLRRLNRIQKARYYGNHEAALTGGASSDDVLSQKTSLSVDGGTAASSLAEGRRRHGASSADTCSAAGSSAGWSEARETIEMGGGGGGGGGSEAEEDEQCRTPPGGRERLFISVDCSKAGDLYALPAAPVYNSTTTTLKGAPSPATDEHQHRGQAAKPRRQFDKRLSAKHIQSKQRDYPIAYHALLLTYRTWLSIVRDPIFFGIQFTMHTTIPLLLALIFGSVQEEGCPQVGNFDLVQFAYSAQENFISGTMHSIRQSVGNIGIIFFEMFVLSFAINCITALVFPLDMYVLLKEYRNGWYSLRSYFFGRTLADLPVPIVLHSMAMCILCYFTGQPLTCWRFGGIIGIVIIASLVAQSIGLTIGALLMRSSQSAVLAAAGIVAPFFALSGFIVRIHTLPWLAKLAAQGSYLYHLLNGFIIMRYGFERCRCDEEDFDPDAGHQIPEQLKNMASLWIGTYSNEFETAATTAAAAANRTNLDPNIDIIDKLMAAFKMANSFGHKVHTCDDVLPYAMLDFNLKDSDIWHACLSLLLMLLISRTVTFCAIYYKIRSFS